MRYWAKQRSLGLFHSGYPQQANDVTGAASVAGGARALDWMLLVPHCELKRRGRCLGSIRWTREESRISYPTLSGGERRPVDDRIETDVPCRHPTEHVAKSASDVPPLLSGGLARQFLEGPATLWETGPTPQLNIAFAIAKENFILIGYSQHSTNLFVRKI